MDELYTKGLLRNYWGFMLAGSATRHGCILTQKKEAEHEAKLEFDAARELFAEGVERNRAPAGEEVVPPRRVFNNRESSIFRLFEKLGEFPRHHVSR